MKRLYQRVYLYIFLILLLSLALSGLSMGLFFGQRERGFMSHTFRRQVQFIRRETARYERQPDASLWQRYPNGKSGIPRQMPDPTLLPQRLQELSEQLGWDLAYWREGKLVYSSLAHPPSYAEIKPQLQLNAQQQLQDQRFQRPQMVLSISPQRPEAGVLWLKIRLITLGSPFQGPLIAFVLLLLFLGLLLLPLTRFLLRPYKDLQSAIQQLAEGRFDEPLDQKKYPAFEELVDSFNQMQVRLEEMMQQKQRLVADVSHELRSPLTRLRLIMELVLQDPPDPEKMVNKAVNEIEELNHIIDDVLEVSRLQLNRLPLQTKPIDLTLLLFELVEQHQDLLDKKELQLEISMPDSAVTIEADPRLLKRLFNNLFSNLVKYVPEQSQVDFKLTLQTEHVEVYLRDRGPGIPAADLDKVFTPFYRTDRSRSRRTGGVGLGLAIVWEIVQAHHGQIQALLPEDGEAGLAFKIHLPLKQNRVAKEADTIV